MADAFFAAARHGDFNALVAVLDPGVLLRADEGRARPGASVVVHGAAVASRALLFARPTIAERPALVNGAAGAVVTVDGRPVAVVGFTVVRGRIVEIDVMGDPSASAGSI